MAAPAAAVKSAMNCEVESVPTAPRGSARRNSIRNRPMLYKRRYIPAKPVAAALFFPEAAAPRRAGNRPPPKKSCTGQSGMPAGAMLPAGNVTPRKLSVGFPKQHPARKHPMRPKPLRERHAGNKAVHPAQKGGESASGSRDTRRRDRTQCRRRRQSPPSRARAERIGAKFAQCANTKKSFAPAKPAARMSKNQGVDGLHVKLPPRRAAK